MTELQYKRWKNFSCRMAWHGLGLKRRKSRRKVIDYLKEFFSHLEHDWLNDPVELSLITGWDQAENHPTRLDYFKRPDSGALICDIVSRMNESWNPHYWDRTNSRFDQWDDLWGSRIQCCLRAGIDVVCEFAGGVIGFTAGDVRRMYPQGVPDWIFGTEPMVIEHWDGRPLEVTGTFATVPDDARVGL